MTVTNEHSNPQPLQGTADVGEQRVVKPPHPCGDFDILEICEQAHRDATGQALCLADTDVRTDAILNHLPGCDPCKQWYDNAFRAYQRLVENEDSSLLEPTPFYQPRPRVPVLMPAAPGPSVWYQLKPLPDGDSLDAMTVRLEWQEGKSKSKARKPEWWVTLKLESQENGHDVGNDEAALKKLDGCGVLLEYQVRGNPKPESLMTGLRFGLNKSLISTRRSVDVSDPEVIEKITLRVLDRISDIVD